MTTNTQTHRPAGTSAGGQFAPTAHTEADVQLGGYCMETAYPAADIARANAVRDREATGRRSERDQEQMRAMQTIARLNRREQDRLAQRVSA